MWLAMNDMVSYQNIVSDKILLMELYLGLWIKGNENLFFFLWYAQVSAVLPYDYVFYLCSHYFSGGLQKNSFTSFSWDFLPLLWKTFQRHWEDECKTVLRCLSMSISWMQTMCLVTGADVEEWTSSIDLKR